MRLGIEVDQEIVQASHDWIFRRRQFVQLGIFQVKVALAHGAFHTCDGMAHHATQSGLSFRSMHDLLDWSIHQPGIQDGRVVAPAAPLGRLGADRVLHVLNRLAVPLVIEGREMMSRAVPLIVDIFVAALAGVRLHKELAGYFLFAVNLR